jgi:hypothetical protein
VEFTYFVRRYATGEDGRPPAEEGLRLTLQGGALGPVADDQRPHRQAARPQQLGGFQQRADPFVRNQAGHHADDVLAGGDTQFLTECAGVRQRFQEFGRYGVRHDEDLSGRDSAGHDLVPHGLAERHHQVGGQHAPGLQVAAAPVQFAACQLLAVRMPGQPGVLPEPAHLVHHRQPVPFPQRQRDHGVGVVARGVQKTWLKLLGQPGGEFQALGGRFVGARGDAPGQQAVIRDAVEHDQAPGVERALGHREAAPGDHVRIEPGCLLSERDLVRADRVPGARARERVVHQVEDAAGRSRRFMIMGRNGRYLPKTTHDHGFSCGGRQDALLGGEGFAEAAGLRAVGVGQGLDGFGEAALAAGQAGGEDRAGAVVIRQPLQGGGSGLGLVDGQAERGQPPGRGVERGQRGGPVARAPQRRRPAIGPSEPQHAAQPLWQYSLGQDHGTDRVCGHVPPGNRGSERDGARRHVRAAEACARPVRGGRHHGR